MNRIENITDIIIYNIDIFWEITIKRNNEEDEVIRFFKKMEKEKRPGDLNEFLKAFDLYDKTIMYKC